MRSIQDFNADWLFEGEQTVRVPHNAVDLPLNYFDDTVYQRPFTYEKRFTLDPAWTGREVSLVFEGAMANAKVSLNGVQIGSHKDGYTPFNVRLTKALQTGENHLVVTIDGSEDPALPPFGGMIDYLTYAGIYRDVLLKVTAPISIGSVKIETPDAIADLKTVRATIALQNPQRIALTGQLTASLRDANGTEIASSRTEVSGDSLKIAFTGLKDIALWDIDSPALYVLDLTLETETGTDQLTTRFGFREARFTTEGFFLNGRNLKLRGLNRHQSFPYVGYALGKAAQVRDADILKHELKLNIVRTSHYPQSPDFLDRCDEIGLLVFEEIPGWQHIGDTQWQAEAVENVRAMIRRDWNHPAIILWGVRINESGDNHAFYAETNAVARALDSTRQTGGVRCITDSECLEDVYTMNDFFLGNEELGGNRPRTPLRPQQEVTGLDHDVPYLVTEYGGHMYPTKSFDNEQRQIEHVTRHLQVMNAAYGDPSISGVIGWCAFDYNTHKDFGSGDRICHHGVMDMFREPKFAAYAYKSQCEPSDEVVLEPVTVWARGDRNIGVMLPMMVLTNCEEIELTIGGVSHGWIKPDRENFPHLPHPPVVIDERTVSEAALGEWGWVRQAGTICGMIGGKKVAEVHFAADPLPTTLQLEADTDSAGAFDAVRVIVRVLDQAGRVLPYLFESIQIATDGPARLIGPSSVPLRGGTTGFWLQGEGTGTTSITVSHPRLSDQHIEIAFG